MTLRLPFMSKPVKTRKVSKDPHDTATDIAAKAYMIADLKELPSDGYAILVLMKPDEDGDLIVKSMVHPYTSDAVATHGLYDYAAHHLMNRAHNDD